MVPEKFEEKVWVQFLAPRRKVDALPPLRYHLRLTRSCAIRGGTSNDASKGMPRCMNCEWVLSTKGDKQMSVQFSLEVSC